MKTWYPQSSLLKVQMGDMEVGMITLTIDGKEVRVHPGTSLLDAALSHEIDIPHLCFHPELSVSGGCRMCVVEVEGREQPTLDCVTCDKAGTCLLQKYAYEYGVKETSFTEIISRSLLQDDNPFFIRDHKYCILCGRCVRVCDEIVGVHAIDFAKRGFEANIATPFDGPMIDSSCVFCGNCVQVCPTAALMPVSRRNRGREWELERISTVCGYCGVGCQIEYAVKDDEILYARSAGAPTVNGDFLCTKGRYGWDFVRNKDRLTQPLIRRDLAHELGITDEPWEAPTTSPLAVRRPNVDDYFVPVSWETAIDIVGTRFAEVVEKHGPDAIMGLASARCTNEENYLFQKFFRAGIGTNNVDHCARL
jgi:formate dehydrogenase alpha subunit